MTDTRNTGHITWTRSIGLWWGEGEDNSRWAVVRPVMSQEEWRAEGPEQWVTEAIYTNSYAAMSAAEEEYTRRAEARAASATERLSGLVAQWQEREAYNLSSDEYGAGYASGEVAAYESCAEALAEVIEALKKEGKV